MLFFFTFFFHKRDNQYSDVTSLIVLNCSDDLLYQVQSDFFVTVSFDLLMTTNVKLLLENMIYWL